MNVDVASDQALIDFLREDSDDVLLDTSGCQRSKPAKLLTDEGLEGEINVPLSPPGHMGGVGNIRAGYGGQNLNTLDEPISETVKRDIKAVGKKFLHVLYPKESRSLLREWDLWGPLMLCICMSILLKGSSSSEFSGPQFAEVFIVYWIGAAVVTLNIKLLGGNISFFQGVCVLGYCVFPLVVALIFCKIIVSFDGTAVFIVRCLVVLGALGWSVFASTAFLVNCQPPKRKPLAVYPIFLFYFFISWIVLSSK